LDEGKGYGSCPTLKGSKMAKPGKITVDLKNLDSFKSVVLALRAAYDFIDILFVDVECSTLSREFDNYVKTRKELEKHGN